MRGKTLTTTTRSMPSYAVMKQSAMGAAALGGAVGGAIAGAIAEKEGATQIARHHIADPTKTISQAVEKTLVSKTGLKPVSSRGVTKSTDPKQVASQNSHANYVLDCHTTSWMGNYYPMTFAKYYIMHGVKMQLIETSTGRVVAQGYHFYQGNDRANAPNYDGIYSNGAAFLKSEMRTATGGAIQEFNKKF